MENSRPHLWVFAGPNGAGKSTLVAQYLRNRLPIVNSDVIAVEIGRKHPGAPTIIEAGKIAVRQRAALLTNGKSFAIETTMSGNGEIRLMRDAVSSGYKVNLVFVGVDMAETSIARVAHRVRLGFHDVPVEDILRRYQRSMDNLSVAMRLVDRVLVVDNTGERFCLLLVRQDGRTRRVLRNLPAWAIQAIPEDLR